MIQVVLTFLKHTCVLIYKILKKINNVIVDPLFKN